VGDVIRPQFNRQKKYYLACYQCNSVNWTILLDPEIGLAIVSETPNHDELDFECTSVECLDCGYTIEMKGMPYK